MAADYYPSDYDISGSNGVALLKVTEYRSNLRSVEPVNVTQITYPFLSQLETRTLQLRKMTTTFNVLRTSKTSLLKNPKFPFGINREVIPF